MVNASMVQSKAPLWYVCRLSPQPCTRPHNVGNTIGDICHALSSSITYSFILGVLAALVLTRAAAFGQIPPPSVMVPPPTGAPVGGGTITEGGGICPNAAARVKTSAANAPRMKLYVMLEESA